MSGLNLPTFARVGSHGTGTGNIGPSTPVPPAGNQFVRDEPNGIYYIDQYSGAYFTQKS